MLGLLRNDGLPNLKFVSIDPISKFIMGKSDAGSEKRHTLSMPHGFKVSQTLITNIQYASFVNDEKNGYINESWWNYSNEASSWRSHHSITRASIYRDHNHPCVNVTWYEAVAFCRWLSFKFDQKYRLLAEAEWELVARGENGRLYPWGGKPIEKISNNQEAGIGQTSPVGIFDTSTYPYPEIYDLIGNVSEWSLSRWEAAYPFSWQDYRNNVTGDFPRVLRGGSFRYSIHQIDATSRIPAAPSRCADDTGFRIVQVSQSDLFFV